MCVSPPTYLTWAILSTLTGIFLLFHLWKFDRFKCLRWNNGPYSGAFKRVMTYTYLITIPLLMVYSIGMTIISYKMGYIALPGVGLMPLPVEFWPESYHRMFFPLNLVFAFAWSFEIITHLEELCFWLFLVHAGSVQQDWFRSFYFKIWSVGSIMAIVYMPVTTIVTRSNPIKNVAATFLAGSLSDLLLNVNNLTVLYKFPSFLRELKSEGVDISTIVRLTTFHELNHIRVLFRFLFTVPLLILGIDGITALKINTNMFASEFLAFLGGVGCMVSAGLTLVVFFPRSVTTEVKAKEITREKSLQHNASFRSSLRSEKDSYFGPTSPPPVVKGMCAELTRDSEPSFIKASTLADPEAQLKPVAFETFAPNRRLDSGATVEGGVRVIGLTEGNLARHNFQSTNVHPFVHNFTSPIDLMHGDSYQGIASYARRYKH
ncbi:uncharacterized protein C8Q71DRAFT_164143 [Rhodofomes roseus]|uniref:Transmembrane protein n=1 Tax=Rhodofomes roseus TaxID=34475 RepID=A0ABQ8KB64_9APHY|nr:uncharacterized protein C8Q71DRAFT_164143 [Rhodofomes roseus]KAH9834170.1 hypothetical protein C8Q71DRAFT_164143 [Rhodofomes roseus]